MEGKSEEEKERRSSLKKANRQNLGKQGETLPRAKLSLKGHAAALGRKL